VDPNAELKFEKDKTMTNRPEIGRSVQANGVRTNYLEAGAGEESVLLIHGSGPGVSAYGNWRLVLPGLAKDFRVIAPDMVGFGYSERPQDARYDLDTWADQAVGVLDALGIDQAHLVGNSFGGTIALRVAVKHPDRVKKLVLMGSVGVPFEITEGLDAVWGYEPSVENMKKILGYFTFASGAIDDELARSRYEGSIQPGFQESFSAMFPAPRQRWVDAMTIPDEQLRGVNHRTLIVHGRDDQVIPLENSYYLERVLPDADLSVFSKCGHWSMIERSADFNRQVRDFLRAS
jgi:pimeloyl-ACP methyl ester carboxylesterase